MEFGILLGHVLQINLAGLIARYDDDLPGEQIAVYKKLLNQRQQGFPVAYITKTREFWSLSLVLNDQVLIPRHETELVVERVLALVREKNHSRILELGTGSGAIALALGSEMPQCHIIATDKSGPALAVARSNQAGLGIHNIDFMESDWYENLGAKYFDVICANPPYVAPDDEHLLRGDVRFEPQAALVAMDNGLADIGHILTHAQEYLASGGWLVLEHGYQQGEKVREWLSRADFINLATHQDLCANDRVTEAQKP